MNFNKSLLLFLLVFLPVVTFSQMTKVYGTIYDAETKEPMSFIHIIFKGTKIGTTTDIDGKYSLESYYGTDSIMTSALGYFTTILPVKKDKTTQLDIYLKSNSLNLPDVVVFAENIDPAEYLFKAIIKNKDANNKEKLDCYEYEVYNKVEFDLNNIDEKFMNRKVLKPVNFIFSNLDSTNGKPYLPVLLTESISEYFYRKRPKTTKEHIKATKITGVENESISTVMGDMYQNINIYENFVNIFSRNFVSPVSDRGWFYYKYTITDTILIGNKWCFRMDYEPRRKQEPTFTGHFWVNDTTYAITSVKAAVADDANINFIQYFEFEQDFVQVEKEVWMTSRDYLMIDFKIMDSDKQMGMYGRKTTSYKNHIVNKPREGSFYSGPENIIVADGASTKSDTFWTGARHDTLSKNEMMIESMIDTLKNVPQVMTFVNTVSMLIGGYKVIGPVEWGPIFSTYSWNRWEGNRFRLGGRTSNAFSKWIELNAYGAYGLKDQAWKYGGGFRAMISKDPRQMISFNYKNDIEMLGQNNNLFRRDNPLAAILRRNAPDKLVKFEEYKGIYEYEWFEGLNTKIIFKHRSIQPVTFNYQSVTDSGDSVGVSNITSSEISFMLRYAKDEKYLKGEFERISLGTKKPEIRLLYTYGVKGLFDSDYEYHKIGFNITQWFNVGTLGWMRYYIDAGKYFGTLPYPLLEVFPGNQTFYLDPQAFNTMNYFEFVADQYITGIATHHFQGLFLNHIPLLRKLKWREVATFKACWGNISEKNENEIIIPSDMRPLRLPYMEASVGIENIFKCFRVDLLWRINYLDNPEAIRLAVKGMFYIEF